MEIEKIKKPTKSELLEHIDTFYKVNQKKKDLEKILKEERSQFEDYVMMDCDGELRIGNYEVTIVSQERSSVDLDFARKALSPEDFAQYVEPFVNITLGTRLGVKRI